MEGQKITTTSTSKIIIIIIIFIFILIIIVLIALLLFLLLKRKVSLAFNNLATRSISEHVCVVVFDNNISTALCGNIHASSRGTDETM